MCLFHQKHTQQRVVDIISYLEQYSLYTDDLYDELSTKLISLPHDLENSFYFFVFCMDWRGLYNLSKRATLYDIYYAAGQKSFSKAYFPLKDMAIKGNAVNIAATYSDIIGKIKDGLRACGAPNERIAKGLYEFMHHFFYKLANVDYETSDFTKPYIDSTSIISRFETDIYDKFINAYKIACNLNAQYKPLLCNSQLSISNTFFLHVLLRHYGPLKVFTALHPNPAFSTGIRNGLGQIVPITAFQDKNGGTFVIPQDGTFMSTKSTGDKSFLKGDAQKIVDVAEHVFPILSSQIKPDRSPNVVYYDGALYGIEFLKYEYLKSGMIIVDSLYPLNSKWQQLHGISQKDYDYIINKHDIPSTYIINVEKA